MFLIYFFRIEACTSETTGAVFVVSEPKSGGTRSARGFYGFLSKIGVFHAMFYLFISDGMKLDRKTSAIAKHKQGNVSMEM